MSYQAKRFSGLPATVLVLFLAVLPVVAQSSLERAVDRIRSGNPAEASTILKSELRKAPDNALAWNLLGIAEAEQTRWEDAAAAFKRALALKPDLLPANENLGLLLVGAKDHRAALPYLRKAVELGSQNPDVGLDYAAALIKTGNPRGGFEQLQRQPGAGASEKHWILMGTAQLEMNDYEGAAQSFNQAIKMNDRSLPALNGAAAAAEKQGLVDEAVAFRHRAREVAPDDVPTLIMFGQICLQRDLIDDAHDALERAYRLAPQDNVALYLLATAKIGLERYPEAHQLMSEFARRVPDFSTSYYSLGWIDLKMNNKERARGEFLKCLELTPDYQHALYELGRLDLDANHLEQAEKGFQRVLSLNPDYANAHLGLGDLYSRSGDLGKARAAYEKCISLQPDLGEAHYKLSMVLFRLKDTAAAQSERKLAEELNKKKKTEGRTWLRIVKPGQEVNVE